MKINNRIGITVALFIGVTFFAHVSPEIPAINYFESPKRFIWGLLAFCLALLSFRSKHSSVKSVIRPLFLLLLWIGTRTLFVSDERIDFEALATWVLPGLLFGVGLFSNREHLLKPIVWALLIFGGLQGVLVCLQYAGNSWVLSNLTQSILSPSGRMIGTIGNQNQLVDVLALSSICLFFLVPKHAPRLLLLGIVFVVITLTGCRGGVLALLGAIILTELLQRRPAVLKKRTSFLSKISTLAILAGLAAGLWFGIPHTRTRFIEAITQPTKSRSLVSRSVAFKTALHLWEEKPLIGWGAGGFAFHYLDRLALTLPKQKTASSVDSLIYFREVHNEYLQFGAEFGWIGTLLIAWFLFSFIRELWRTRTIEPSAMLSTLFILSYLALKSLVSFPIQAATEGPLAGLLLGLLLPQNAEPEKQNKCTLIQKTVLFIFSIGILTWVASANYYNTAVPTRLQTGEPIEIPRWISPHLYKQHALIGAALAQNGRYSQALHALERSHKGYRDTRLYNNLGFVYSKLDRNDDAIKIYQTWANCGLKHSDAMSHLSRAHQKAGNTAQAAQAGEAALLVSNQYPIKSVQRILTLYVLANDMSGALRFLEHFEATTQFDGKKTPAKYDNITGAIFLRTGDSMRAKKRFQSALKKNPHLESAQRNISSLQEQSLNEKETNGSD